MKRVEDKVKKEKEAQIEEKAKRKTRSEQNKDKDKAAADVADGGDEATPKKRRGRRKGAKKGAESDGEDIDALFVRYSARHSKIMHAVR